MQFHWGRWTMWLLCGLSQFRYFNPLLRKKDTRLFDHVAVFQCLNLISQINSCAWKLTLFRPSILAILLTKSWLYDQQSLLGAEETVQLSGHLPWMQLILVWSLILHMMPQAYQEWSLGRERGISPKNKQVRPSRSPREVNSGSLCGVGYQTWISLP